MGFPIAINNQPQIGDGFVSIAIYGFVILSGELYNNLHQTRCPLLLVADYRFFNEMGGGSSKTTVNYLISLIDRSEFDAV